MSILNNSNAIESGGYPISNSLRFQSASSQYLSRTPASAGNRKTWTWSAWVKRGNLSYATAQLFNGYDTGNNRHIIYFEGTDQLYFQELIGGATQFNLYTSAVFRDPSAWYHIVVAWDTTQATASNRVKIWVNNVQQTLNGSYPSLNFDGYINGTQGHTIGKLVSEYFDGYMTEINFVNAQALTPSSFGETNTLTGQWVAKKYTGTYGTNGFYLPFSNGTSTTTLGADSSGNGNNWTLTNFTRSAGASDCWMKDVPSGNGGVSGTQPSSNYCVWSPIDNGSGSTLSAANLNVSIPSVTGNSRVTIAPSSGKWYWETQFTSNASVGRSGIILTTSANNVSLATTGYALDHSTGQKIINGTSSAYGNSIANNDVVMYALDLDNGKFWIGKNNTWFNSGDPAAGTNPLTTGLSGSFLAAQSGGGGVSMVSNTTFGQRSWVYTPPSGFKALCTANLPASTIVKGNQYMDATTYTGNGSTQTITNAAGFSPDLVWIKIRSTTGSNVLSDVVRGTNSQLFSNLTDAEQTRSDYITAFNSNGFSLGAGSAGTGNVNSNGATFVGWQWDAGSSTVTNASGSISSQVRANTTAGVSIVTYTGTGANATVGHGLGVAPKMMIVKNRTSAGNSWAVYHANLTSAAYALLLDSTAAQASFPTVWNSTAPTSSVFSVGTSSATNGASSNIVAYCFAEIAGFSKFGSYTGNGSADGPFIYLGFRPKYIMIKKTSAAGDSWYIKDTSRSPYNVGLETLLADTAGAEAAGESWDALSNGIKLRTTGSGVNTSGATYIYMAFAENPFAQANAR